MPQRLRGLGTVFRGEQPVGRSRYSLQVRVTPVDRATPERPFAVSYISTVEGTIALLDPAARPPRDNVVLAGADGRRYALVVESSGAPGTTIQRVSGTVVS